MTIDFLPYIVIAIIFVFIFIIILWNNRGSAEDREFRRQAKQFNAMQREVDRMRKEIFD